MISDESIIAARSACERLTVLGPREPLNFRPPQPVNIVSELNSSRQDGLPIMKSYVWP